jgi:DNA-binding transcriptional LysR family regulator
MARDPELRLADIDTFLVVNRLGSISAAARELMVTPSQVSKAVGRLESHFRTRLLRRSAQGVQLSEAGARLAPRMEEIVSRLREMGPIDQRAAPVVTVAAPSYMNVFMLPAMAVAAPDVTIRSLELPPSMVRTLAPANLFDATMLLGPARLPSNWSVTRIGACRKALYASPRLAEQLGPQPVSPERLRSIPFIRPVYNVGGQFVPVDDDCPMAARRNGHESQTIGIALELAARTDQLVYGPAFAATQHVERGAVVEVPVQGWNDRVDMHFACNGETLLARLETAFVAALRRALGELERRDDDVEVAC